MASLIFSNRNLSGQVYELANGTTTAGHGPANKLILHDDTVSTAHGEILVNGPEVIVHDLGSRNGTFVNGARLDPQGQLKSGQTVRFGSVEARLELGPPGEDTGASEMTAVHAHGRALRDQRRARQQPEPAAGPKEIGPQSHPGSEEHTVSLPKPAAPAVLTPTPPAVEHPTRDRTSAMKWILAGLAFIIGGILLAWWLRGPHGRGH